VAPTQADIKSQNAARSGFPTQVDGAQRDHGVDMPGEDGELRGPPPTQPDQASGMSEGTFRADSPVVTQAHAGDGITRPVAMQASRRADIADPRMDNASSDMLSESAPRAGDRPGESDRGSNDTGVKAKRDGESALDDDWKKMDPAKGPTAQTSRPVKADSNQKPGMDGGKPSQNKQNSN